MNQLTVTLFLYWQVVHVL